MNAASMLKLMSAKNQFSQNHPKFEAFLKSVFSRRIEEGTVIEVTVTRPGAACDSEPEGAAVGSGAAGGAERAYEMIYMTEFTFPDIELEYSFLMGIKRTCYDTFYPFQTLSRHGLRRLDFEPITILYGGNGSGKTTALNVIAEKAGIRRESAYNRSNFFEDYTKMCGFETCGAIPKNSRIITSDDVFDFVLNLRSLNDGISLKRRNCSRNTLTINTPIFR